MFQKINLSLLPMKAHYFLFNSGTAPVVPFLSTYARQLGFSSFTVGLIYTILPICGMIAKPLMGTIADRFQCQRRIFLATIFFCSLAVVALFYAPGLPVTSKITFACDQSESFLDTCIENSTSQVDECAAVELSSDSGTTMCQLTCPMEPSYWNTICNHWQATEYCNSSNADTLTFTAHIRLEDTLYENHCLHFKVSNATLNGNVHYPNCPSSADRISTVCDVTCDSYVLNDYVTQPAVSDEEVYDLYQFWAFLALMILFWIGQAIVVSVGDAICFELLGDKPNRYGQQRVYGALGWGVFSAASGFIIDAHSAGQSSKNYISAFYLAAAILLVDALVSWNIKYEQNKVSKNILKDVGRLLTNVPILVFMAWCIAVGMCTGLIWQFLFWLIEDLAAAQGCDTYVWIKTLQGLVMGVQCVLGELPFFFFSGWILKRIGHVSAMSLILLVIGIRYVLYSVIKNPWWFLPIELTNGLTFGLFYASMASYASIVSPAGTETTVQGMVGAVFEGVGVSLGSFIGGLLYNKYGGPLTFRIFGIGALIACLVHAGVQYLISFRKSDPALYKGVSKKEGIIAYDEQQEVKLMDT